MDVMELRRRIIAGLQHGSILPAEYQQVEWVGCDGTQYIVTDFIPNQDYVINWRFMMTASQSGDKYMFGANGAYIKIGAELYDTLRWYCNSGLYAFSNVLGVSGGAGRYWNLDTVYDAEMSNGTITINSFSASSTGTYSGDHPAPKFALFGRMENNNTGVNYVNSGLRLYRLTLEAAGQLAANFVPCYRKSDNEIGFYDTVANAFYGNSGTGTLLKGADV